MAMSSVTTWMLYSLILFHFHLGINYSNEIYIYYNHSNAQYWTQNVDTLTSYSQILRKSFYVTLANLTGRSMNISQQLAFENESWTHGGIENWTPCVLFNIRLSTAPDFCPSFPIAPLPQAKYVAVAQFQLVTDGDLAAFRQYINQQLSAANFEPLLRHWLITLDDTNTKRPTLSPTNSISPTLAPSGTLQNSDVSTTQNADPTETETETLTISTAENTVQIPADGNTTNEKHTDIFFVTICVVFAVVIIAFIVFIVCWKHARKRTPQFDQMVSTTGVGMNSNDEDIEYDEGAINETSRILTPQSIRL